MKAAVPVNLLEELAAMVPTVSPNDAHYSNGSRKLDAGEWLAGHGLEVSKIKPWQGGTLYELQTCPWNPEHRHTAHVIQHASGALSAGCFHNSCGQYGWRDLKGEWGDSEPRRSHPAGGTESSADNGKAGATASPVSATATQEGSSVAEYRLSDVGNAARFAALPGQDLRYVGAWGQWLCWDGVRWQQDLTGEVMRRARQVAMSVYREAAAEPDEMRRKALSQHAVRLDSDARIRAMLHLAESEPVIAVRGDVFDRDPWLFNCQNGTLDLKSGKLYPHRREDYITKLSLVVYDPSAMCPTWDAFLRRIFAEDSELIAYVQRVAGYCLTGNVSEQGLEIWHGVGSNGKSTMLQTWLAMVGDYGKQAAPGLLMRKYGETHPTELADLRGARLAVVTEVEEGQRLAESLTKQMTGNDRLKARFMRQDFHEFDPTFKIVMAVNHLPRITGTDHAIWRRIRTTPFGITIPDGEQDKQLPAKLKAELAGILAWAVRGCLEWQERGLNPPPQVTGATADYRAEMDTIGDFLRDCTTPDAAGVVTAKAIYAAYVEWCEDNGERALTQKQLGGRLGERGFSRRRGSQGHLWVGLTLKSMTHDPS